MRTIDHRVGVPLCALFSPIVALLDWITLLFKGPAGAPRRLLFIELSEMGSAIIVDPAMRDAQARGAEIFFLIFKSNRASLTLLNTVPEKNIFTIDSSSVFTLVRDTIKFLFQARAHKIDTVIDLELFSRFTALLTGLCGARKRVGYHIFHGEGLWRGTMLTHKVHYNPHIHIAKNFLSLIHAAFSSAPEQPYSKVHIPDSAIQIAQAVIDPTVKQTVLARIHTLAQQAQRPFEHGVQPLRCRLDLLGQPAGAVTLHRGNPGLGDELDEDVVAGFGQRQERAPQQQRQIVIARVFRAREQRREDRRTLGVRQSLQCRRQGQSHQGGRVLLGQAGERLEQCRS
ncbi:MAG: hypothetical protein KAY62_04630, partial [Burkholderiaceae bacterium]|nr:hypothetical protein [Burkholderiaceae bacterium]